MNTRPAEPPILSDALLEALWSRWHGEGWPGVDWLRPGLSGDEIDAMTAPLGIRLPGEPRRWWGWHDGVVAPKDVPRERFALGAVGFPFLPLAEASIHCRRLREAAIRTNDPEVGTPDETWHPTWFPFTIAVYGATLAIDCSDPDTDRTPIRVVDWADGLMGDVVAGSVGELVSIWIDAIDLGAWRYDSGLARWERDWNLIDDALTIRRLV